MSNSFSPGIDNIPSFFVKKCAGALCYPLSILFNLSIMSHVLPVEWLYANVVPIFKKGNSSHVNNYRPISLTSVVCKTMESVIKDHVLPV